MTVAGLQKIIADHNPGVPPAYGKENHPHPVVLIIGGGYSGAALAIRLLEQRRNNMRIVIAEPRSVLGGGQAYSTADKAQLMNGPAGNFSIHRDNLTHLADWVERNSDRHDIVLPPDGASGLFIPRSLFGHYVQEELQHAIRAMDDGVTLEHWQTQVIRLDRPSAGGRMVAGFADGRSLHADLVVLATGVFPLATDVGLSSLANDPRLATPWNEVKLDRLSKANEVLIVGASLSMVDTVASLEARGFTGRYQIISRRGHLIEPVRTAGEALDIVDQNALPCTARELLALVISARRKLLAEGRDWQVIPLSLRPFILRLWQGSTTIEQLRFTRHLRSLWDVTLHRAAPPSYAAVERAMRAGRFTAQAARLVSAELSGEQIEVSLRPRGQRETVTIKVDGIIDARGHQEHDWSRIKAPLVRHLLENGLVRRHDTGFGIDATTDGGVRDQAGTEHGDLFAIGHPLRGVAWESSSLTELREQAQMLAAKLDSALRINVNSGQTAALSRRLHNAAEAVR
ncbi:NAD(P)-binding protein [Rhizobiales bacterium RZME27]|uniref:NAD(P)-binding protein n=1 Tax=Endobacterium cereale TaxID=2663029 RepID=A0A6A8AEW9_9HYPH|nr:FAD/NAD(P)-binding protein [Endobacterium cereale]MEB2847470.1 FAD/NAD(P)-binding protein [Endobacterium cereale]MQY49319.1 NAD(P)-binding protein [Endobacterium cereale]